MAAAWICLTVVGLPTAAKMLLHPLGRPRRAWEEIVEVEGVADSVVLVAGVLGLNPSEMAPAARSISSSSMSAPCSRSSHWIPHRDASLDPFGLRSFEPMTAVAGCAILKQQR